MTTFRHTPEMGEISGFGGGYEDYCQDMLEAGVKWVQEHPDATLKLSGFRNIYGIVEEETEETKELSECVLEASKGQATGAMHQNVMSRLLWIKAHSWEEYVVELIKNEEKNNEQEQAN